MPTLSKHFPVQMYQNPPKLSQPLLITPLVSPFFLKVKFLSTRLSKAIIALLILLAIISFPAIYDNIRLDTFRDEVYRIEQCRFYVIDDDTRAVGNDYIINRINSFMEMGKLDCSKLKANVYFSYREIRDATSKDTITQIVSYCPYNSTAQCVNYKEYSFK